MSNRKTAPAPFFLNLEKFAAFLDKEEVKLLSILNKQNPSVLLKNSSIASSLFIKLLWKILLDHWV